jgi:transcriptional regulator with XRE-family HTH domain
MTSENIGTKIKELRTKNDLSLNQLATKANISKAYVSQLENGESSKPSAEILYNIALALNTSIAHLLGRTVSGVSQSEEVEIPTNLQKIAQANGIDSISMKRLSMIQRREGQENNDYTEEQWMQYWLMMKSFDEKK